MPWVELSFPDGTPIGRATLAQGVEIEAFKPVSVDLIVKHSDRDDAGVFKLQIARVSGSAPSSAAPAEKVAA